MLPADFLKVFGDEVKSLNYFFFKFSQSNPFLS